MKHEPESSICYIAVKINGDKILSVPVAISTVSKWNALKYSDCQNPVTYPILEPPEIRICVLYIPSQRMAISIVLL